MKNVELIITKYQKIISLQTDLSIINTQLNAINPWSTKYINVSNQRELIYEEIRQLEKEIDALKE